VVNINVPKPSLGVILSLVRPTLTWGIVATQAGLAVAWAAGIEAAPEAFKAWGPFSMMAMTYWFVDRTNQKQNGGGGGG